MVPYVESSNRRRRRRQKKCETVSYAAENSSVFRCALKVVMIAELLVTGDREFQTAGAVTLNALDWKFFVLEVDPCRRLIEYIKLYKLPFCHYKIPT